MEEFDEASFVLYGCLAVSVRTLYGPGAGFTAGDHRLDCNWKLDGKPQGVLKADDSTVVQVSSGKHLVQATSTDGLSTFRTVVEVEVGQGQEMVGIKLKADHQRQIMETARAQHPTSTDPSTRLMWAGKDMAAMCSGIRPAITART